MARGFNRDKLNGKNGNNEGIMIDKLWAGFPIMASLSFDYELVRYTVSLSNQQGKWQYRTCQLYNGFKFQSI